MFRFFLLLGMSLANIITVDQNLAVYEWVHLSRQTIFGNKSEPEKPTQITFNRKYLNVVNMKNSTSSVLPEGGFLSILILKSSQINEFLRFFSVYDWVTLKEQNICCVEGKYPAPGYKQCDNGGINMEEDLYRQVLYYTPEFKSEAQSSFQDTINVYQDGVYYIFMANCAMQSAPLTVQGEIIVKEPYGYLPGEQYPYLQFYLTMTLVYFFLLVLWISSIYLKWSESIQVQKFWITSLVVMCFTEKFIAYFDWSLYNETGFRTIPIIVAFVVFNAVRNSIARMSILVVSLGYGVTKPQLGETKNKVICLGFLYFLSNIFYNSMLQRQHHEVVSLFMNFIATTPLALLNTFFYYWIFVALLDTEKQLNATKQDYKKSMFRWLLLVLVMAIVLSIIWLCIELFFKIFKERDDYWQILWLFEAVWHGIFLAILIAVMWLWRPTAHSKRMLYSVTQIVEGEEDLEDFTQNPKETNEKEIYNKRGSHSYSIGTEEGN